MGLSTLGRILYNIGSNFVVHTAVTRHALLGVFLSWGIFTGQVEHHEVAWNQKAVNIGPHLMAGTVVLFQLFARSYLSLVIEYLSEKQTGNAPISHVCIFTEQVEHHAVAWH